MTYAFKEKIAKVSAYQQNTEWSCSAATLKAAALHWDVDLTEKEVIKAVGARKGRGAETDEIVAGAQKLGFKSWEKSFKDLAEAKAMLKRGVPIIADFQSFNHPGKGHYVLIVGFKPGKGFVIMDPNTKGKTAVDNWRILSEAEMEKKWWDRAMAPPHKLMPKWGVMIMPKQKEKTASFTYGNSLNRAKAESRAAKHAWGGKYSAGDVEPPTTTAKQANGDMMEYFQKNPKKLEEYKARQAAKKKTKEAGVKDTVSKLRILRKASKGLTWAERKKVFGDKAKFTFGAGLGKGGHGTSNVDLLPIAAAAAGGTAVGTGAGYAMGRSGSKEKQALDKKKLVGAAALLAAAGGAAAGGIGGHKLGDVIGKKSDEYYQKKGIGWKGKPEELRRKILRGAVALDGGIVGGIGAGFGAHHLLSKLGNDPIKKKLKVQGITVWLEWLKGEERTYYNHDPLKVHSKGKLDYKTKMKADYGYVPKRYDADGEDLDIYLGDNHESTKVFVLKQIRPSDGSFDEHKIMLGYDSIEEAKKSYLAHMPKKYLGSIRATNIAAFKKEFLMGKARFQKKAMTKAQLLGMAGGGAIGAFAGHKMRKNQEAAGVPKHKRTTGILSTGLGMWAGADIGNLVSATRRARHSPASKAMAAKYLRNPMIAGGVLGGGLSAGKAHLDQKREGKNYKGRGALASGLEGALHGTMLGGMGGAMASQLPGASAKLRSKAPKWGKKAKTQKEFIKNRQAQARKHHPDLGGSAKKMSDINAEADAFMKSDAFRKMPKHASASAFAHELRLIMEANARV